jgi:hypothetical protein
VLRRAAVLLVLAAFLAAVLPARLLACACGCGVFDVGTSMMLPTRAGGFAYLQYDSMDQNRNWSGAKSAPADDDMDKRIRTDFFTGGVRYMFDRSWGAMIDVPVVKRHFVTTDSNGVVGSLDSGAIGDIRVRGVYSGFSPDMSSGLTFGLKLPTGPFKVPDFDRDTQIGTGSTDLLLGAYHVGRVPGADDWDWFADGQWDEPVLDSGGYRPGAEIDASLGSYYAGWSLGGVKIAPLAQVVGSLRWRDLGATADPADSGYRRVLLSPGLELMKDPVRVYADVGFPVYQFMNGNQLVASELYKLNVGWSF